MRTGSPAVGPDRSTAIPALAVLAGGTVVLGTSELGICGLIPAISTDLEVSPGAAGALVSVYAVAVALAGPVLTAVLGGLPHRRVLVAALAALAAGNGATAVAPCLPALLAARALTGAAAAVYVTVALTVAAGLTGPRRQGRAVAVIFGGVTVSTVVAFRPAPCWPVSSVGAASTAPSRSWRPGCFSPPCASCGSCRRRSPRRGGHCGPGSGRSPARDCWSPSPPMPSSPPATTRHRRTWSSRTGLGTASASALLLTSGIAGTVGTVAGGVSADRDARRTVLVATALLAASLCALPLVMTSPVLTWLVALLWAAAFTSFSAAAALNVSVLAGAAAEVATAANISVFNAGIASGSAVGGLILPRAGFVGVTLAAAALVVVGLATAVLQHCARRETHSASAHDPTRTDRDVYYRTTSDAMFDTHRPNV